MTLRRAVREARDKAAELERCALVADILSGDYRDAVAALAGPMDALSVAIRDGAARLAQHGIEIDPAQVAAAVIDADDPLTVIQAQISAPLRGLAERIRASASSQ